MAVGVDPAAAGVAAALVAVVVDSVAALAAAVPVAAAPAVAGKVGQTFLSVPAFFWSPLEDRQECLSH